MTVLPIAVNCIQRNKSKAYLGKDETLQLQYSTCPRNATVSSVVWESYPSYVASVSSTGVVTAHTNGVATVTVRVNGTHTATCQVTVDTREKVIVEEVSSGDETYNRIVFADGKIWNCADLDIINDYSLNIDDNFSHRFYDNTYQTKVVDEIYPNRIHYYEPMVEYTDEEIKLIYTIDPYGMAAYVREYAYHEGKDIEDIQDRLRAIINYKNRIFYLLFNRQPKYYRRNAAGTWFETTDTSNLLQVLSESEFLFDRHQVYDIVTLQQFITVAVDIFSMAIQCPALNSSSVIGKISKVIKYYSLVRSVAESVLNADFKGFITAIADGLIDDDSLNESFITPSQYKSKNYTLGWVAELLSLGSDLGALAETFESGPSFYKEIFTQCDSNSNYRVMFRTTDNELLSISDIKNVIQ